MEDKKELVDRLQNCVNEASIMLVELEIEDGKVNQTYYEYQCCIVNDSDNDDTITFNFFINKQNTDTYTIKMQLIQRFQIYNKGETLKFKHFFLLTTEKEKEPLLIGDMFKIYKKEVSLLSKFNMDHLYNKDRSAIKSKEKSLLQNCYDIGLFTIRVYEITPKEFTHISNRREQLAIAEIKKYPSEHENVLKGLLNITYRIKEMGIDVEINKYFTGKNNYDKVRATAYIPSWNLIIQPNTQNIETILEIFAQVDKRVCIVSDSKYLYDESEKYIVYLIERKNKFKKILNEFYIDKKEESLE